MKQTLDVRDHARFLDGYLDAVGRVGSTDSILAAAGTRLVASDDDLERKLGVRLHGSKKLDFPAKEVESTVAAVLGLGKGRLPFYLVDYIMWFLEFVPGATLAQLNCSFNEFDTLTDAFFLVEAQSNPSVVIYIYTADKPALNQSLAED
ncbi:MAG: hypothetical protein AAF417_07345 [Pseudomonadota bacterium]